MGQSAFARDGLGNGNAMGGGESGQRFLRRIADAAAGDNQRALGLA